MTLALILQAQREEILDDWEEIVRSLGSARALPHLALRDHIPAVLDWVIGRLAHESPEDDDFPQAHALQHALGRIDAGYDLSEVLSEYMVLRDCLHDAWERSAEGGSPVIRPREVRRLNQALDDAITYTAVVYVRTRLLREERAEPVVPVH